MHHLWKVSGYILKNSKLEQACSGRVENLSCAPVIIFCLPPIITSICDKRVKLAKANMAFCGFQVLVKRIATLIVFTICMSKGKNRLLNCYLLYCYCSYNGHFITRNNHTAKSSKCYRSGLHETLFYALIPPCSDPSYFLCYLLMMKRKHWLYCLNRLWKQTWSET